MILLMSLLFLAIPLLSLPIILVAYFRDIKHRGLYSLFLGLFFGIIAYYLKTPDDFDLVRHHQIVDSLTILNINDLINMLFQSNEPLTLLINFIVSRFNNVDILQLLVVSIGYWILFYIIGDYAKRKSANIYTLFLTLLFTLSSFTFINFASGLWNYLAMLIFSLAFYWENISLKNKKLCYLIYAITPLIHTSMFLPCFLLIIFKLYNEHLNLRLIIVTVALFIFQPILYFVIHYFSNITLFSQLESMYQAYFINGAQFTNLYGGNVMVMETSKIILYIIVAYLLRKKLPRPIEKIRSFIILLSFVTLLITPSSIVSIRFVLLIQFIGSILLIEILSYKKNFTKNILILYMVIASFIFLYYQSLTLKGLYFGGLTPNNLITNFYQIINKGAL